MHPPSVTPLLPSLHSAHTSMKQIWMYSCLTVRWAMISLFTSLISLLTTDNKECILIWAWIKSCYMPWLCDYPVQSKEIPTNFIISVFYRKALLRHFPLFFFHFPFPASSHKVFIYVNTSSSCKIHYSGQKSHSFLKWKW